MRKTLNFKVKGMHCASCEKIIQMDLEELKGIEGIHIDHKTGVCFLRFDPDLVTQEKILETINNAGYEASNL